MIHGRTQEQEKPRKLGATFTAQLSAYNMTKVSIGKLKSVPDALQKSISRTQVEYRRLGKSGLRVSNPILGGLHIGDSRWFPWVLDEKKVSQIDHGIYTNMRSREERKLTITKALPLLKAAYDRGINTVST